MRNADIFQIAAIQAVQSGPHLCALAPFLKGIPAFPDEAGDLPGRQGGLSQYCFRAPGAISWVCVVPKDANACADALYLLVTFSSPAA